MSIAFWHTWQSKRSSANEETAIVPTYQYVCTDCGGELEAQQSFRDDALTVCPTCQGKLRKVFGAVGVVFKGSGFYRTDSRAAAEAQASSDGDGVKPAAKEAATTSSKNGDSGSGKDPATTSSTGSSAAKESAA